MAVRIETRGHVAEITLDRPESLNALDVEHLRALRECLVRARDDTAVRAIVLTGAGGKAFCTGADLKGTLPPQASFAQSYFLPEAQAVEAGLYTRLFDLSDLAIAKPLIAAINGWCLGGGLEIALQCDLRIASASARLGLPECKVASIPAVGGIQYLMRAVPGAIAMKMLLTGEPIDAAHAARIGLVSDVYEPHQLAAAARELAERIAANGPLAVQMIKKLARASANMPLDEALRLTEIGWGVLRDTEDRIEGRKAFAEKRKAVFRGR